MPTHRVFTGQPHLDGLGTARQLGQRPWDQDDLQLDFGGVESATPEFAAALWRAIVYTGDTATSATAESPAGATAT